MIPTLDDQLRQALDNEQQIDVSNVPDVAVMALPTNVKLTCLAISDRLGEDAVAAVLRLKRVVKVRLSVVKETNDRD